MKLLKKFWMLLGIVFILNSMKAPVFATMGLIITGQPTTQSVNAGQTVTFKIAATGKNLKYQWQISTDGKTWTNSGIESGKTNAYTFTALDSHNGRLQRCVVTDANGDKAVSEVAKLNIAEQLKITGQPASQSVNAGQTVTFKIAASGKNLKYQWQISTDGKTWTNSGIESGKTNAYTFTALDSHNGRLQRCVVTDVNGNKAVSETAKLNIVEQLKITGQPTSQSVNAGQTVTFKIAATGKNLKYQWQISTDGKNWTNSGIESGKTNAYTFTALDSHNGRLQRCVVTDVNGNKVISNVAIMQIIKNEDWELPIL